MVPAMLDDKYVIRYCVNSQNVCDLDIETGWEQIKTCADDTIKQYEFENPTQIVSNGGNMVSSSNEEEDSTVQLTSRIRRLRFGISKMVSEPRMSYNQKKYKRISTTMYRFGASNESVKNYLARRCSIIEKLEDELN